MCVDFEKYNIFYTQMCVALIKIEISTHIFVGNYISFLLDPHINCVDASSLLK